MKVCMMTSSYPRHAGDGAGSYVKGLAQALVSSGHQVHVVAPHDPLVAAMDQKGVRVHRFRYAPSDSLHLAGHGSALQADTRLKRGIPILMPGFAVAAMAQFLALHRRERFDIVHAHWAVPSGAIAGVLARVTRCPLVITLHGSDVYLTEKSALYAGAARFGYRAASCVTAVCQDLIVRAACIGLDAGRSEVIPCGVDTERYALGDAYETRDRLGLPRTAPVIGALGRLVRKKGFSHLVSAMPEVLKGIPDANCVIAGDGDLRDELAAQAERLGVADRVHFPGHIDWQDTAGYYAMCDAFVLPSVVDAHGNVDGLPNVLLEAMASGCGIVASRLAGIPSLIEHQATGLLVPPGDVPALVSSLLRLLRDPDLCNSLGVAAREKMAYHYDWSAITSRFLRVYGKALQDTSRRAW